MLSSARRIVIITYTTLYWYWWRAFGKICAPQHRRRLRGGNNWCGAVYFRGGEHSKKAGATCIMNTVAKCSLCAIFLDASVAVCVVAAHAPRKHTTQSHRMCGCGLYVCLSEFGRVANGLYTIVNNTQIVQMLYQTLL